LPRPVRSVSEKSVLPEVAELSLEDARRRPKFRRAKVALALSLAFHAILSFYLVYLIRQRQMEKEPFDDLVVVDWVPPPPVKLKIRPRQIPQEIPKVAKTQQEAPSALTTRLARRSPQEIAEVIVKGPEIVRESVEINREAPISQILPIVTTAAQFEAKAETRDAISPPVATPTAIATPGAGLATNRVRAAGGGDAEGLSNVNSFGSGMRGASGAGGDGGDGLGKGFDDVGTTPPKVIEIDQAADKQAEDLFGIGEYVEETRGSDTQEIVYVLDVSSSMTGTKLKLAVMALKDALSMLHSGDSFNIVTFDKDIRTYSKGLLPLNRENLNQAYRFLDRLETRSGTNLWGGLERALTFEAAAIVLISDGDPSRGVTDSGQIRALTRAQNTSRARIMTIALGNDFTDRGVRLLKSLANDHGGRMLLINLR
jgi:hypothetical protein